MLWNCGVGETPESPFDCKEIKLVRPKGNQSWIFFGGTNAEAEPPILRPPDVKSWLFWKDPDAGKDWRQEEKGMTEDEMVGWHHLPDRLEFGQALVIGEKQRKLACCRTWDCKESDMTEQPNWTELTRLPCSKVSDFSLTDPLPRFRLSSAYKAF